MLLLFHLRNEFFALPRTFPGSGPLTTHNILLEMVSFGCTKNILNKVKISERNVAGVRQHSFIF